MPRVVFGSLKQAQTWVDDWVEKVRGRNYALFYCRTRSSLIFVPTVSTDPIIYGVVNPVSRDEALEWKKANWPFGDVMVVSVFDWDSRRDVD